MLDPEPGDYRLGLWPAVIQPFYRGWRMTLSATAGRLLVPRLSFVPNKDLFFANFAITLVGYEAFLSALMAEKAALTLLVHAALIVVLGLYLVLRNRV